MVITSYYDWGTEREPLFPGADVNIAADEADVFNNPAGTISHNEIYGMGQFGLWTAYVTGNNQDTPTQPNVVFDYLTIWNAALRGFVYVSHTANVTFDHMLLLGDQNAYTRADWGAFGVTMDKYETWAR